MDRRTAIASLLAAPLLASPAMASAARRKRVGYVSGALPQKELIANPRAFVAPPLLMDGLKALGWKQGTDVEFVWRSAEGHFDRLGAIYEELIAMPVDVLVVTARPLEAASRTRTTPIVMNGIGAWEELRSQGSKNFPANLTGLVWSHPEMGGKRLALLKAVVPSLKRVALAFDERVLAREAEASLTDAARRMGVRLIPAPYRLEAPEAGLERALSAGAEAIILTAMSSTSWPSRHKLMNAWLRRRRILALHGNLEGMDSGGVMAFAPSLPDVYRRVPYFVDKVLRGTPPQDLPLEQPAVVKLIVNVEAAREIGLTIPPEVLIQADKVIG